MKLASVGDNCIDNYVNTGDVFAGGNSVNVSVYFKRLGGDSSYIGVVGNDKYGGHVIEQVRSKGVDTSHINILKGSTAITQVELVDGERVLGDYNEGVSEDFKLTDEQKSFILNHDIVATGLWGNIHNDLKYFKDKGMIVAFDGATRPFDPAGIIAANSTDYFFFAIDNYTDDKLGTVKRDMKKIHSKGAKHVIATLGEKGSMVYDGKDFYTFGIVKCDVIDTMGAGDSYIAGYLKGVLEGHDIPKCMELGAKNASETISYKGAW